MGLMGNHTTSKTFDPPTQYYILYVTWSAEELGIIVDSWNFIMSHNCNLHQRSCQNETTNVIVRMKLLVTVIIKHLQTQNCMQQWNPCELPDKILYNNKFWQRTKFGELVNHHKITKFKFCQYYFIPYYS